MQNDNWRSIFLKKLFVQLFGTVERRLKTPQRDKSPMAARANKRRYWRKCEPPGQAMRSHEVHRFYRACHHLGHSLLALVHPERLAPLNFRLKQPHVQVHPCFIAIFFNAYQAFIPPCKASAHRLPMAYQKACAQLMHTAPEGWEDS
jgi:hypothetical protein